MTSRGRICPKCRQANLVYGQSCPVEDGLVFHRRLKCRDCGHSWQTEERINYDGHKNEVLPPIQILDSVALLSNARRRTIMDVTQALLSQQRSEAAGGSTTMPPWGALGPGQHVKPRGRR